ncbi:MAG: glycosyltransferase, partial [Bacilli bacterium]|nr:glycosyltransferase [Bacilli bacterium]
MNNLVNKAITTLKEEGIISLTKKGTNYMREKAIQKKDFYGDILIINGCTLPHPQRYRVDHQIEQLRSAGLFTDRVNYEDLKLDKLKYYRGFIFYRCPITPTVEEFIKVAKEENKTTFFDIDDLVIDRKYTDTIQFVKDMKKEDKAIYDDGVERMRKTLLMCDYLITSTEGLKEELNQYNKEVYINRNVASEKMVELSKKAIKEKEEHNDIIMGYLSGSITHNPDLELIKPVLMKLLKKYDNLKLKLVGEIDLPEDLKTFKEQIIIEPFVDWKNLPKIIASLDINLVPLEKSVFNEAKSENKWVEAALTKTVTIASNVGAFKQMIKNGEDGILAENNEKSWEKELEKLIQDKEYRNKLANHAYNRVMKDNVTIYTSHGIAKFVRSKLKRNIGFVLPTTNISGGVNVVIRHIAMLKKAGYDVTIINMDNNNIDLESNWGTVRVIKNYRTMFKGTFDTLVATLWTTLDFIKKYPNVKNKMYLVQNFETDFADFGKYMRIEANQTYEDNTGVKYLTISKWCKNWLEDKFEKKSYYAPNGIDLEQFKFIKRDFKGKIRILVEGNSEDYYKNVDESFKIVEKLDKEKYEIHFLSYQGEPKNWYYVDKFMHKVPYKE